MDLITVVIPVYNVEKYLRKCIDSVVNQTYKNLDIILVDDGSKDNSGAICDEYAFKDSRIRVFHKENGGLSSARNLGIDKAYGDYIGFIDSDDYIDLDMYEVYINLIKKDKTDIVLGSVYDYYIGKKIHINKSLHAVVYPEKAIELVLKGEEFSVHAVSKLYKKSLFDSIRFPVGKQSEDAFISLRILNICEKVTLYSKQKYYYVHRENSITSKNYTMRDFDVVEAWECNYKMIVNYYPQLVDLARTRLCWARYFVLDKMLLVNQENTHECKGVIKYLRKNTVFILTNKALTKSRKIAAITLLFSVKFYKQLLLLYRKKNMKLSK